MASTDAAHDAALPIAEPTVLWSDERQLGHAAMDRAHEDFYRVVLDLLICTEATAPTALQAFEVHAEEHFGQEERWMRDSAMPGGDCHVDEHARVLASVRQVRAGLRQETIGLSVVHDLAAHLFRWFPGHADTMDSAVANWLSRQQHGGQPMVLRRRAAGDRPTQPHSPATGSTARMPR